MLPKMQINKFLNKVIELILISIIQDANGFKGDFVFAFRCKLS